MGDSPTTNMILREVPPGFAALAANLKRIFGRDFQDSRHRHHPLGRLLVDLQEYHRRSERRNYDLVKLQLEMHAKHLAEVQTFSDPLFRKFRKRLLTSGILDEFEAIRFEVDIAASLARYGEPFEKSERPDFTISTDNGDVCLECTSVHLTTSTRADAAYKILAKTRDKGRQPYCSPRTALFIDGTAYLHRSIVAGTMLARQELGILLQEALRDTAFGSLLLWSYVGSQGLLVTSLELMYFREDAPNIHPELRKVLDRLYPIGREDRTGIGVPGCG